MLLQGEEVGERLAGMFELAKGIDDRNGSIGRHLFDRGVAERAQHDEIDPAFEIVGDVVERLAGIEPAGRLIDKECAAA